MNNHAYTRIIIHLSSFIFPIMLDEITPSVSMVSRDLCGRFCFLKEGDGEIDGTLILKRQIKIFDKLLVKVRYSVTSLISLTHCKVG